MHRIVVIANPAASQFTGGSHRDIMAMLSRGSDVASIWPGSPTEAEERARESAEDGVDVVVAMGGDGMVHHVTQGLVGTGVACVRFSASSSRNRPICVSIDFTRAL